MWEENSWDEAQKVVLRTFNTYTVTVKMSAFSQSFEVDIAYDMTFSVCIIHNLSFHAVIAMRLLLITEEIT